MKNIFTFSFALILLFCFQSTKAANSLSLEKPLVIKWKIHTFSSLIISKHEKLLTLQPDGNITSVSLPDGQILWRNNFGGNIFDSIFKDKSSLITKTVNVNPGAENTFSVIAINTDTGTTKWKTNLSNPVLQLYYKENESIILLTDNTSLLLLNSDNGEISKSVSLNITDKGEIHIIDSKTLLNQTDEAISLYSLISGRYIWKTNIPYKPAVTPVCLNNTIFVGLEDGYIQAYDIVKGKLTWSNKLSNKVQSIIKANNGLLVNTSDNYIYFFNLTGKLKWKKLLDGKFSNNYLVQDNSFLIFPIGSNVGTVLNLKNGGINNRIILDESDTTVAPPVSNGKFLFLQTQKSLLAYANY